MLTEALHGTVDRGVFRARRTDSAGADRALVTLAPPQTVPRARLHQRLEMTGTKVAALRHLGPLEDGAGRYDGMVEDEPAGRPLRGRRLTPHQAIDLAIDLCDAVGEAGQCGAVLGGLRPELIYVDDRARLTRMAPRCEPFLATSAPPCSGTPHCFDYLYAAPELSAAPPPTTAADVFSIAAVLAELIAGEHPFVGDDPNSQLHAIACGDRRPWRGPAALAPVIDRGLATDPSRRLGLCDLANLLRALR